MKTPREILLGRHQATNPKLDEIRRVAVEALDKPAGSEPGPTDGLSAWIVRCFQKLDRELILPRPQAWVAVAAAWILIFALKLSTHEASHVVAKQSSTSPEVIAEVRQQKLFFAELVGIVELRATTALAKPALPRPRSERRHKILMG